MIVPVEGSDRIHEVETRIFQFKYFRHCMDCTFCKDACCNHGANLGSTEKQRILDRKEELLPVVRHPVKLWFVKEEEEDEEMPGGILTSTNTVGDRCVFLNPAGRGCLLHSWAMEQKMDYHDIKPMVCTLFPVTFEGGCLTYSDDIEEGLVCAGDGDSLYQGARDEILHYFGPSLVEALDRIEKDSGF